MSVTKKQSIKSKIVFPIILILLVQMVVIVGAFFGTRTVFGMRQDARDMLMLQTQNVMLEQQSAFALAKADVDTHVLALLEVAHTQSMQDFWDTEQQAIEQALLDIMDSPLFESAYFIMEQEGAHKLGFLLTEGQDGIEEIVTPTQGDFVMDESNTQSDFYFTIKQVESMSGGMSDPTKYGMWHFGIMIETFNLDLFYTIPFVHNGQFRGVIGAAVKVSTLANRLAEPQRGVFALGTYQDDIFFGYAYSGDTLDLLHDSVNLGISEQGFGQVDKYQAALADLTFEAQDVYGAPRIVLVGLVPSAELYLKSTVLTVAIAVISVLTPLICIICLLTVSKKFCEPINSLCNQLSTTEPQMLDIDTHKILEIDNLVEQIKRINSEVERTASKLERVISLADIPIAAFEYKQDSNVFFTANFFKLLNIAIDPPDATVLPVNEFFAKLEQISGFLMTNDIANDTKVYNVFDENGESRWLQLKVIRAEDSTLGVVVDITRDVQEKSKIEYERDHDPLTHLLNRRAFAKVMNELGKKPELTKHLALVMFDLDNFKFINDTYGHDTGDRYICAAVDAARVAEGENVVLSRRSGDEFVVCLFGYETREQIQELIEKIHQSVNSAKVDLPNNKKRTIGASMGVAWLHQDADNFEDLYKYADFAMYTAKREARGELKNFDKELYDNESFILFKSGEFKKLVKDELVFHVFQPIVDLKTAQIYGYEALMRSQTDAFKSPQEILMMANALGAQTTIEELTFFKAMDAYKKFEPEFGNCKIFINSLTRYRMREHKEREFFEKYCSDFPQVVVEFTENAAANSETDAIKREVIRGYGGLIALDDFGRGQSMQKSLSALKPDFIKIDLDIIRNINADFHRQHLVSQIINYAHGRGIKIVAEGIEIVEDLRTMIRLGADYAQGFYLCHPSPVPAKLTRQVEVAILQENGQEV